MTRQPPRFKRAVVNETIAKPKIPIEAYDYNFFDEDSKPITLKEWAGYSSAPHRFNRESKVNGFTIRTYWTGIDMPHPSRQTGDTRLFQRWVPNEPPLIFEQNVYDSNMIPVFRERYATRDEAYEGHSAQLRIYKERTNAVLQVQ